MIIKNRGYTRKYVYGGANILTSLWDLGRKALSRITPRVFDFGKKKAVEFATKGAEALGKKAGKKAVDIAKGKINQLLASKSKNGIQALPPTDPSLISMEAPTIDKPLKVDNGINRGLSQGLGIKII